MPNAQGLQPNQQPADSPAGTTPFSDSTPVDARPESPEGEGPVISEWLGEGIEGELPPEARERVRDAAGAAERAVAAAQAHQDMLNEAVARLQRAEATFQQTAQTDWDTRLALPGDFQGSYEPTSMPAGEFYNGPRFERPTFEQDDFGSEFVIAPTD